MDLSQLKPGQKTSVKHLDGPLLISAGAGSGKTFTLTQRVAYALLPESGEGGAPFLNGIDEVLVITFTEKAAGEIKDRIRSTLRAEGMFEAALQVDAAWISTIHGMCARILREHALEIGMDPAFSVLSTVEEDELRTAAIMQVLDRMKDDAESPYHALLETLGVTQVAEHLQSLLSMASRLSGGLDAVERGPQGTPLNVQAQALCEMAETYAFDTSEKYAAAATELAQQLRTYLGSDEDTQVLSEIVGDVNLRSFGAKAVNDLKLAIKDMRIACRVVPYYQHAQQLLALARDVQARFEASLVTLGCIDMAGLIRRTLDTFRNYPRIAAEYTNRFKLIMVDEFQDTSQLQIDMIECIAGETKQRLCTVGDAQQSIYRFQGADVGVYLQHKQDMRTGGAEVVQLDDNFRSHADILAFVRKVCGQPGYFQEDFLDLQAASEGQPFKAEGPRVELTLTAYERGKSYQACVTEARYVAKRFAHLRKAGHAASEMVLLMGRLTSAEIYAQALRNEGFACIVTGGSHYFESPHVQLCLNVLDVLANPYNSESLLAVLTSEALPVSTEDLLYLSTTHDELGHMKRQNPARAFLLADAAPAQSSALLNHASAVLKRAWSNLGVLRPAQLFMQVVLESGWLGRLEAGGIDAQAKAADILKFARLVEEAQGKAGHDMARVARTMREASCATGEKPGALSVENLDAVRIMTVHASKGLEFPIVAVADCYENSHRGSSLALYTEGSNLYVSLQGPGGNSDLVPSEAGLAHAQEPGEFRANMLEANKTKEYEEKKRLFYVACTRASAALLVGVRTPWSKNSGYPPVVADILAGLCPGETDFPREDTNLDFGGSQPLQFVRLDVSDIEEDQHVRNNENLEIAFPVLAKLDVPTLVPARTRDDFFSYSSLAQDGSGQEATSASDISERLETPGTPGTPEAFDASETAYVFGESDAATRQTADADKATDFGSALHRVCEWYALQAPKGNGHVSGSEDALAVAVQRAADEFGVQDTGRLQAAFARWQQSDACAWAFAFETRQAELPFVVPVADKYLEGEIDLFCASGKQAGIIDYKTGGIAQESSDQLYEKHLLQAQCYASAALQAGYESVELRFVRVEQADPQNPSQPQVVRYAFDQADAEYLRNSIQSQMNMK